jgi:hypothetical protein
MNAARATSFRAASRAAGLVRSGSKLSLRQQPRCLEESLLHPPRWAAGASRNDDDDDDGAPLSSSVRQIRAFSASRDVNDDDDGDDNHATLKPHQRVWRSNGTSDSFTYWTERVIDHKGSSIDALVKRIIPQESQGGRMRQRQLGVLHDDPVIDMQLLTDNVRAAHNSRMGAVGLQSIRI